MGPTRGLFFSWAKTDPEVARARAAQRRIAVLTTEPSIPDHCILCEPFFEGFPMLRAALLFLLLVSPQDPVPLRAGFAEVDISPAPGTRKIGWNNKNFGTSVIDP